MLFHTNWTLLSDAGQLDAVMLHPEFSPFCMVVVGIQTRIVEARDL